MQNSQPSSGSKPEPQSRLNQNRMGVNTANNNNNRGMVQSQYSQGPGQVRKQQNSAFQKRQSA